MDNHNEIQDIVERFFANNEPTITSKSGKWEIKKGGYDLVAEIYENNLPVCGILNSVNGYEVNSYNRDLETKATAESVRSTMIDLNLEVADNYKKIKSKSVDDSDGFATDYTMYFDRTGNKYIFVFGDSDLYENDPNITEPDPDWECDTRAGADEWFDNYKGFDEEPLNLSENDNLIL